MLGSGSSMRFIIARIVFEAAFDAERWRIATATVEDDDSVPNTYFRYSVWRREDVG